MAKGKALDNNVFGLSFIDVFANTIGGLAFILILVILMIGLRFGHPIINTEQLPDAYHNTPYETWFSAREGGGFYNWQIISGELPAGLKIENSNTGRISGIPQISDRNKYQEDYSFTVQVNTGDTAKQMTDTREFSITVFADQYGELKITTADKAPKAIKDFEYPMVLSAQGGMSPYNWQIKNTNLSGIELSEDGKIEGIIKNKAGIYQMDVLVKDKVGNLSNKNIQIEVVEIPEVQPPPPAIQIKTDSLPSAIVGKNYKIALSAEGGRAPYEWSGSTNVSGFEISEDGYLAGIPEKTGEYNANFKVEDEQGSSDNRNIKLTVLPAPREKIDPLKILYSDPLPEALVNTDYTLYLSATGGTPAYNWSLLPSHNIPGKISLDNEGKLLINITDPGEYKFQVEINDNLGLEAGESFTIKIKPSTPELKIDMDNIPSAVKGFKYGTKLNALGGYAPYKWTIAENTPLPYGLTLDNNGLTGIPADAWQGDLQLKVQDNYGNSANKTVKFEILESGEGSISHKLELLTDTLPSFLTGDSYMFCFATKGGAEPKSWEIEGELPKGIVFGNGILDGEFKSKGVFDFTIRVSDATGQSVEKTYSLETRSVVDAFWKPMAIILLLSALFLLLVIIIVLVRVRKSKRIVLRIVTESVPNARCSFPYKVYLSAIGGVPPYKWIISEGNLPDGLTLLPEGIIEGEPLKGVKLDDIKEINFEVKVTDSIGTITKQQL